MLVFFGDHLPSLPLTLKQTGVADKFDGKDALALERRRFLYEVPLVVWSNVREGRRELGSLGTTFLGPLVLEEAGLPNTPYTGFLEYVRSHYPVVTPHLLADAEGQLLDEAPDALRALEREWWTLEYDALFGERYGEEPVPVEG